MPHTIKEVAATAKHPSRRCCLCLEPLMPGVDYPLVYLSEESARGLRDLLTTWLDTPRGPVVASTPRYVVRRADTIKPNDRVIALPAYTCTAAEHRTALANNGFSSEYHSGWQRGVVIGEKHGTWPVKPDSPCIVDTQAEE